MTLTQNINNSFFNGIYKDVWRQLIPAGLTEAEADFIIEVGAIPPQGAVLDIMCGYGRHSLELGRRGYKVTAVDNQQEYISEIKATAARENSPIEALERSVLEYMPDTIFDAAICMGNSFAFFNEKQAMHVLRTISGSLKPGGVFIINTWMLGEIAIRHYKEKEWFYAGEYKYIIDNSYKFHPSRIEAEHTIIAKDGSLETMEAVDYIFTLPELEIIFDKTGFGFKDIYSTPRKRPFSFGDSRAYIVAEKLA